MQCEKRKKVKNTEIEKRKEKKEKVMPNNTNTNTILFKVPNQARQQGRNTRIRHIIWYISTFHPIHNL